MIKKKVFITSEQPNNEKKHSLEDRKGNKNLGLN